MNNVPVNIVRRGSNKKSDVMYNSFEKSGVDQMFDCIWKSLMLTVAAFI